MPAMLLVVQPGDNSNFSPSLNLRSRRRSKNLSDLLRYEFRLAQERQEAERKRIEAAGIRDFQNIISQGLTPGFLTFRGIEATLELAKSPNAKVLVYGDKTGLPLLLGTPSFGLGDQAQPK